MSVIRKLLGIGANGAAIPQLPSRGDLAYYRAMDASDDLRLLMEREGNHTSAARSIISDVWAQAKNIPFMTTVYEAVQEAKTGPETAREERFTPFRINGRGGRPH